MKILLLLLLFPISLCAQMSALSEDTLLAVNPGNDTLKDTVEVIKKPVIPELNYTDSLGMKQGKWMFLGSDFPNSGVGSGDKLEEGLFSDNARTGLWYRFDSKGAIRAVMRYVIDPKTKISNRDQFYYYTYHSNGTINRRPEIGLCSTASDYYIYDDQGSLLEAEKFDGSCNTTFKVQRIAKGELDSIEIFRVTSGFNEVPASAQSSKQLIPLDQTGDYCVDYDHRFFQIGTFEKGELVLGREIEVDEMMRPLVVRYIENKQIVRQIVK